MPRKYLSEIFDPLAALYRRHDEIPRLRDKGGKHAAHRKNEIIGMHVGIPFDNARVNDKRRNTEEYPSERTLDRLFRAYRGYQLVLAEQSAAKLGKNVGRPRADKDKKAHKIPRTSVTENNDRHKRKDDVYSHSPGSARLLERDLSL